MRFIEAFDRALARLEGWLLILLLWSMIILTFLQVVLRTLYVHLHQHWASVLMGRMDWAELLVRLSVLWLTFLGASLVTGENRHIRIDLLSGIFPRRWLPYRELLLCAASALISALMIKASLDYITAEMSSPVRLFSTVPMWVGQVILPIGFSLLLFRFLFRGMVELIAILKGGAT